MRKGEARMRVRLDDNVRCECGRRATQQVMFEQRRASGERLISWLPLCDSCYEMMTEDEGEKITIVPFGSAVIV